MGIFKSLKKVFSPSKLLAKGLHYSQFLGSGILGSLVSKTDVLDFYTGWVYACVKKRAEAIATIEFDLYKLNGKEVEKIEEHDILTLLYKVNPEMTKFDFLELSSIYLDFFGVVYWVLFKNEAGQVFEVWPARPDYFSVVRDVNGDIKSFIYKYGNSKTEFKKDEVVIIKDPDPKNPDIGLGIIESLRIVAQIDDYSKQWNKNLLQNDARPSGLLNYSGDGELSDNEIKRLSKQFSDKYAGYDNAYRFILLQGGLKFEPLSIAPKDMEFVAGRNMNRDEICAMFGVPKTLLGLTESVNRATAEQADYTFAKRTIEPRIKKIVEQLNEFFVPLIDADCWLDFEPIVKESAEDKLAMYNAGYGKWLTPNEIRNAEGMVELQGGDYIYQPLTLLPVIGGEKVKAKAFKRMEVKVKNKVNTKLAKRIAMRIKSRQNRKKYLVKKISESIMKSIGDKKLVLKIRKPEVEFKNKITPEAKERFYKNRMTNEPRYEKLFEEKLTKFFTSQKQRFLKAVENNLKSFKSFDGSEVYYKDIVSKLGINASEELKSTIEIISPLLFETAMAGVKDAYDFINATPKIDTDKLKKWTDKVAKNTGESINDTTINDFKISLTDGIENGESLDELSARVAEVFDFATETRSVMIARTETARAVVAGHLEAYEEAGFEKAEWLLAPDACEICQGESTKDWTLKDIQGEIPAHPNCKCDFTPIV